VKVYIAGPMRGIPEFNFPAFDDAAVNLWGLHAVDDVFNPAERDRGAGFDVTGMTGHEDLAARGFDLREALAADMEYISLKADTVAVLPGWEKSSGARAEVALAHALGHTVAPIAAFGLHGFDDSQVIPAATPPSGTVKQTVNTTPPAPVTSGEVRTVSATGGEKGTKDARFDLIPTEALTTVARLYGRGAAKYSAHNWRKGYEWSKSFAALQRHATQFWAGEDTDEEMGLPHMAAVVFHALALLTFMEEQPGFDDRYAVPVDADSLRRLREALL
jgi:hypothetical protein